MGALHPLGGCHFGGGVGCDVLESCMNFIRKHILSRGVVVFMAFYVLVVGLYNPRKMLDAVTDAISRNDMVDAEVDRLHQ